MMKDSWLLTKENDLTFIFEAERFVAIPEGVPDPELFSIFSGKSNTIEIGSRLYLTNSKDFWCTTPVERVFPRDNDSYIFHTKNSVYYLIKGAD